MKLFALILALSLSGCASKAPFDWLKKTSPYGLQHPDIVDTDTEADELETVKKIGP